jgi:rhodanese-related sulfurtransferase
MIIGVIGFIGSGKGTVADILVEKHGFVKLSFADAVKDATAAIFGWQRSLLEGDTDESREFREKNDEWWANKFGFKHFSPRLALQLMGTEAGRDVFHKDVWVYALERKMEMYKNVVIADVRFPNEIEWMRSKGGFAVRVMRGPDPEWYNIAVRANSGKEPQMASEMVNTHKIHYSEWAWAGQIMDYQLDNNGSISSLEGDVFHMLKVFSGPIVKNQAA